MMHPLFFFSNTHIALPSMELLATDHVHHGIQAPAASLPYTDFWLEGLRF